MTDADLAIILKLAAIFAPLLSATLGGIWAVLMQAIDELISDLCQRLAAWALAPPVAA